MHRQQVGYHTTPRLQTCASVITLDAPTMDKVANALGVSADAIRNFNEEATFNIISNNYHDHSSSVNYQFNPIEKIIALYKEQIELYERMIKENVYSCAC